MSEELFELCSKQANADSATLLRGRRALYRVGSSLTSEALPAALCPNSLPPYTAARLGTSPSAVLRSRQGGKKKKKSARRHCAGAGHGRGGPARKGVAGSERGSDGPPAPGPLGTVVFVKKHAPCFGCHGLADPPKQANGITQ